MKHVKPGPRQSGDAQAGPSLLLAAIEGLVGPALVLDERLAVVHATSSAADAVGTSVQLGTPAVKLICGSSVDRPVAEALARGVAVMATVERPAPGGGSRSVVVRASPIVHGDERLGWVLSLSPVDTAGTGDDAIVLFHAMWTRDPAMKRVFHVVDRAARRDAAVLVRGETGTGKELVGRAIHALSSRRDGPFAAINCAALPPALLESELFGHVRGAFTGATADRPGFFQAAHGGTLFLDEVAEMPLELQAKLLRVLETKTVIPVGGREPITVDVRIVAATHESLRRAVQRGSFRSDLMYRLRVIPIFLPPLRDRPGDITLIAEKLIEELNAEGGRQITRIAPAALEVLEAYPFPGNVRELRNALEYAYVIGDGPVLVPGDLPLEILDISASPEGDDSPMTNTSPLPAAEPTEVTRIRRALDRAGGNRERAAEILGMSRVTLWRHMQKLGMA